MAYDTAKSGDTWYEALCDYDREYDTTRRVFDGWWYGRHLIRTDSDGNRNIFNVEHDNDELWLNWNNGNPDNVWNPDNRFVFVLPRNSHHFSPDPAGEFCF